MKKQNLMRIFILASFLFASLGLNAQIRGELKDKDTKENVMFANIGLLNPKDSSIVKGGVSDQSGKFRITGLKDGDYILKVSFIGYETYEKTINYKGKLDLGTIYLTQAAQMLEGYEIVEKRPLFSMDGDKTVYSVEDDPSIQTGTTTDALQNAPGVQVDAEGNITLQGVSCVEIWLNDKPSKIKEDGLKTFLENLPANALQKIEVMTNPPAKYANTSGCGVINIVTNAKIKKNHFISFGSGINTLGNISPHLSYVWANEKLNIGFYSSFNIRNNHSISDSYTTAFIDNSEGGKDTLYHEVTHSDNDSKNFGGWLSFNVDYEIDSTSSFGFWSGLGPNYFNSNAISQRERSDYQNGEIIHTSYRGESQDKTYGTWGYVSANYDKRFDNKGHRMNLSLDGNFDPGKSLERAIRVYSEQNSLFENLNKEYASSSGAYSFSLDGRYSRPFENGGELGCGMGLSLDNDYNIKDVMAFDSVSEIYSLMDSLRSHNKHSNNYEMSAFLDWRQKLGDFTFTLGLNTDLEYRDFIAENTYFADDTTMMFFTLRPNIRLSYRTKSMHDISASYSFSSSTPSTNNLSTFRNYEEESYSVGNRELGNAFTHRMGLRWSKFFKQAGYVSASFSSSWSNNSISSVTDMVNDEYLGRYISFSMPYNLGSSSSQSLMLMGNLRLGAFTNLNIYTTLSHDMYAMDYIDGNHYEQENTSLRGNVRLWSRFSEQFQVFIGAYTSTPTKSIFSQSDYYYNLNFGATANFFDKRLTLSLRVEDPFNWNKSENSNFAPYLHSSSTSVRDSRFIAFNISLKFGKLELENRQAPTSGGGGGGE